MNRAQQKTVADWLNAQPLDYREWFWKQSPEYRQSIGDEIIRQHTKAAYTVKDGFEDFIKSTAEQIRYENFSGSANRASDRVDAFAHAMGGKRADRVWVDDVEQKSEGGWGDPPQEGGTLIYVTYLKILGDERGNLPKITQQEVKELADDMCVQIYDKWGIEEKDLVRAAKTSQPSPQVLNIEVFIWRKENTTYEVDLYPSYLAALNDPTSLEAQAVVDCSQARSALVSQLLAQSEPSEADTNRPNSSPPNSPNLRVTSATQPIQANLEQAAPRLQPHSKYTSRRPSTRGSHQRTE